MILWVVIPLLAILGALYSGLRAIPDAWVEKHIVAPHNERVARRKAVRMHRAVGTIRAQLPAAMTAEEVQEYHSQYAA